MARLLIIAALAALLAACETGLSEEACLNEEEFTIGLRDGQNGARPGRFLDRAEQCGRYGVPLDAAAYEQGRQEGLKLFCTPEGALDAGLRQRGSIDQCGTGDPLVREAFYAASRVAGARDDLDREERHYDSLLSRIDQANRGIAKSRNQLRDEPVEKQRQELANRIARFRRDRERAENGLFLARLNIDTAFDRLRRAEDELSRVRAEIAARRRFEDARTFEDDGAPPSPGADPEPRPAPGEPEEPVVPPLADDASAPADPGLPVRGEAAPPAPADNGPVTGEAFPPLLGQER